MMTKTQSQSGSRALFILVCVAASSILAGTLSAFLHSSQALEDYWQRPITAEQLQGEMSRMAQHTKQPEVLRELFEALGNDTQGRNFRGFCDGNRTRSL